MIRFADVRVLVEVQHQPFVADRADDAFHLGRDELHLRLRLELRVAVLDR